MQPDELRRWRRAMDWTQTELAQKLGVSRDAIVKYEAGKCNISKPVQMLIDILKKDANLTN